jgi:hypothetical protein
MPLTNAADKRELTARIEAVIEPYRSFCELTEPGTMHGSARK